MQVNFKYLILTLVIGGVIGWFIKPNVIEEVTKFKDLYHQDFTYNDTSKVRDSIYIPVIKYKYLKPDTIRDTIVKREYDSVFVNDLVEQFECLQQKLIDNGFQRIQYYQDITSSQDTVSLAFETIGDKLISLDIQFGVREYLANKYHTLYIPPNSKDKEPWWEDPALATGGVIVGYMLGGIGSE